MIGEYNCLCKLEIITSVIELNLVHGANGKAWWNSNRLSAIRIGANSETTIPLQPYCSALVLGTTASHINGFYLISRKSDTVSITPLIDGLKNTDFQVTVVDSALIAIKTQSATDMRVIYIK